MSLYKASLGKSDGSLVIGVEGTCDIVRKGTERERHEEGGKKERGMKREVSCRAPSFVITHRKMSTNVARVNLGEI